MRRRSCIEKRTTSQQQSRCTYCEEDNWSLVESSSRGALPALVSCPLTKINEQSYPPFVLHSSGQFSWPPKSSSNTLLEPCDLPRRKMFTPSRSRPISAWVRRGGVNLGGIRRQKGGRPNELRPQNNNTLNLKIAKAANKTIKRNVLPETNGNRRRFSLERCPRNSHFRRPSMGERAKSCFED